MRLLVALAILALAFGETCGPDFGLPGNFTNANEHAPPMPRPRPGSALVCNWEASVSGLPRQCCCVAGLDKRCLPHVIIAGAQKSGSTALFGYLLFHPNFAKPSRKEVHAFDNRFRWSQDIGSALRSYLQSFEPFNPSKVSGEASPSYILGYDTAKIIVQVVPDSKVIVLLRNPVDRFYSEYNMKLRRVEGQMDKVRDAALLRTVFDTCKSLASEAEARAAAMDWLSCITDKIGGYPPFVNGILDKKPRKMRFTACLDKVTRGAGITYEAFVDCFGAPNIPQETLDRLEDVVNREVDQVRRCMTPHQRSDVTLYDGRVVEGPLMDWGTSSCWPTGSDSFISKDFVVRGVYYPQLVRLFQFLNPNNVLILEDDDLKLNAVNTMDRVWSFLEMPKFDISRITNEDVHEKFNKEYPTFENQTGWRMNSTYGEMPPGVRKQLADLYKPFNDQLYKLLNRRFAWDD